MRSSRRWKRRGARRSVRGSEHVWQCYSQPMQALRDGDTAVEQEGADLVGNGRALADEAGAHPVQGLQVELFLGLGGDEAHGRTLDGFGDGLRIAVVVFVTLEECTRVLRGHESGVVAEGFEPAA